MSDIRYPEDTAAPPASTPGRQAPGAGQPQPVDEDTEAPEEAPWQAAVIRVSTMLAVWLGY